MPKSKQPRRMKKQGGQRGVADWSGPAVKHGPFGIFSNVRLFYIVGALIMVGSVATGWLAVCVANDSSSATETPEPTANLTVTPEPTDATGPAIKQYSAPPPMTIDAAKGYTAVVETDKGEFSIELLGKDAPNTVNNFVFLARDRFYDGLTFHFVAPGFSVQGGDPTGTGAGGSGYELPKDENSLSFERGSVGMANGSQFFVVLEPSVQFERGGYWVFGRVREGMDVVDQLAVDDKITSIEIIEQ